VSTFICLKVDNKLNNSSYKKDTALHYTFTAESAGERILKIGQNFAKLWARIGCPVFSDSRVVLCRCLQRTNAASKSGV